MGSWSKNVMRWAIQISALVGVALLSVTPATAQSLDGVWRSEGYGFAFNIRGGLG